MMCVLRCVTLVDVARCPTCSANLIMTSLKPVQAQARPAAAAAGPSAAVAGGGGAASQLVCTPRVVDEGPFVVCDSKLMKLKQVSQTQPWLP